jgi:hypothetical protein
MMLVNSEPPLGSLDALAAELSSADADGRLAAYLEQPTRLDALTATAPHRLYVLDVEDLTADDDASVARYSGWRYLLEVNRRAVAIATTVLDEAGRHSFGGIATGPAVASVVFAVHVADELLRTEEENFVIAAIGVPALHLMLLQLSNADASRLRFLPIGLASGLHPAHLYSRTQARAALRRMASRVLMERTEEGPIGG